MGLGQRTQRGGDGRVGGLQATGLAQQLRGGVQAGGVLERRPDPAGQAAHAVAEDGLQGRRALAARACSREVA